MDQCEMGLGTGGWHVLVTRENFLLLNLLPLHIMEDDLLLWTLAKSPDKTRALSRRCLPPSLHKSWTAESQRSKFTAREKLSKANLTG